MPLTVKQIAIRAVELATEKKSAVRICCDDLGVSTNSLRQELYATRKVGKVLRTGQTFDVFPENFESGTPIVVITRKFIEDEALVQQAVVEATAKRAPGQMVVFNTDKLDEQGVLALRVLLARQVFETIELVGVSEDEFKSRFPEDANGVTISPTKRGIVLV